MSSSAATTSIPAPVIVLLCILGAGGLVTIGFAFHNLYTKHSDDESSAFQRSKEQDDYMREVRRRNHWWNHGHGVEDEMQDYRTEQYSMADYGGSRTDQSFLHAQR